MNCIISCHLDSVFNPDVAFMSYTNGKLTGALLACALIIKELPDVQIEFNEAEETTMDGARQTARKNDNKTTLFIVMDVTDAAGGKTFTVENIHRVKSSEIRKALENFKGKYKIIPNGTESEAWVYKDQGFCTLEVDIPVRGGIHSLGSTTSFENVKIVSEAIIALVKYFKEKTLAEIEEPV
jgi:hypothetical protein